MMAPTPSARRPAAPSGANEHSPAARPGFWIGLVQQSATTHSKRARLLHCPARAAVFITSDY